jgi:hypothetical protein
MLQLSSGIHRICKINLGVDQSLAFMAKFIFDLVAVYHKILELQKMGRKISTGELKQREKEKRNQDGE